MKEYGNGIVFIGKDSLQVDTGLSEREVAQGRVLQNLSESGMIITQKSDKTFEFAEYSFNDTFSDIAKGRKNESVYVKGPAFHGVPFYELLENDREGASKALNSFSLAVEYALENNIVIPNNGPLGTIIGTEENNLNQILILPPTIFEKSLNSRLDSDYSKYCGIYKKVSLQTIDSWRFTLSTYAYKLCTGQDAYTNFDSLSRIWDYLDFNFVEPEYRVKLYDENNNEIDSRELFSVISNNLKVLPLEAEKKSKRNRFAKPKSIALPLIPENFEIKEVNYKSNSSFIKKDKKIKRTRFFRKNSLLLKILGISLAVILVISITTYFDKKDNPDTLGLSDLEVVEMMYKGFNDLDFLVYDGTFSKKSVGKSYEGVMSNVYVTSMSRGRYDYIVTYTFDQWLNVKDPENAYMFGISNLSPTLLETSENHKKYMCEYYMISYEPNIYLSVSKGSDIVELTFIDDRWKITNLEASQREIATDIVEFTNDIKMITDSIPEDEIINQSVAIIENLKDKYPWLPTVENAKAGYDDLFVKYPYIFND